MQLVSSHVQGLKLFSKPICSTYFMRQEPTESFGNFALNHKEEEKENKEVNIKYLQILRCLKV